jgi:hypothetical protein
VHCTALHSNFLILHYWMRYIKQRTKNFRFNSSTDLIFRFHCAGQGEADPVGGNDILFSILIFDARDSTKISNGQSYRCQQGWFEHS